MRIGTFSKHVKTTVKTLRYYDRIGLFSPANTDIDTGYRNYTLEQISDFEKIRQYRAAGLSVEQIQRLFNGESKQEILFEQQKKLQEQEQLLRQQKEAISVLLNDLPTNMYTVSLKDLPTYTVCTYRTRVSNIADIPPVFSARFSQMKKQYPDLPLSNPNYCCVTFTDTSHKDTNFEVEYAEAVTEPRENKDGFAFKTLIGGTVACIEHRGSYENIASAYAALFKWISVSGYQMIGAVRERFIHGAWDRKNEADWLFEIQVPIQLKGGNV